MTDPYLEIGEYCLAKIQQTTKRPLLIGMVGDSGSGKSYFSKILKEIFEQKHIPYSSIDFDDFLIPRKDRIPLKDTFYTEGVFAGKSHWEILENWFYLDKFQQAIADLQSGKPTTYYPYLRATGEISPEPKTVEPEDFILFDTSLMAEMMDFVILVEVDRETIIQRKLERDSDVRTPEQIREMHEKVQGYYWDRKKPQQADIVIDNNVIGEPRVIKG